VRPLRTLIVDDEPLAVERMQLLCAVQPGIDVVGAESDGAAALRSIGALSPDLVLLDIAMPGLDGLAVARALEASQPSDQAGPAIIFVTAFDQFAIEAFDVAAVDYLLKPVSAERLARSIERVEAMRQAPSASHQPVFTAEFWVPHRSGLVRVATADIERIDAERDYMRFHQTITILEARLDPALFIRLHRSVIVRRDRIGRLGHDRTGAWHAELIDGSIVRIGRTYLPAAKAMTGSA
jgi:two-component system, LytTR family, response regulator AlgR